MLINHDSANYFDLSTCNSDLGAVTVTSHDPDWPDPGLRGSLSARSRPTVEKKTRVELTPDLDGENQACSMRISDLDVGMPLPSLPFN